jgi:hypothetical protein
VSQRGIASGRRPTIDERRESRWARSRLSFSLHLLHTEDLSDLRATSPARRSRRTAEAIRRVQYYLRRRRTTGIRPNIPVAIKATVLGSGVVVTNAFTTLALGLASPVGASMLKLPVLSTTNV